MGKEMQLSGKLASSPQRKHSWLLAVAILISLILSLTLQGCGGPTAVEPPLSTGIEGVVEEATEETAWCDPEEDFYAVLDNLGEHSPEGIIIEICIPDGINDYFLDPEVPDLDTYPPPIPETDPFPIITLISYLKILDSEGEPVYEFNPGLIMRVNYSKEAWYTALEEPGAETLMRPRVAYLIWEDPDWIEPWVEFEEEIYQVIEPNLEDPESVGYLEIIIEELPDPLIGGC